MMITDKEKDPLRDFEKDLVALVQSIQHYTPNTALASNIIQDSDNIGSQIEELQQLTKSYANYDTSQQKYDLELSGRLRDTLNTLIECKRSLDNLPKPNFSKSTTNVIQDNTSSNPNIEDTKTILSYALKLSKFSKIPRTYDGFLLPNNFIWPGDDNMRRGNLAIVSMIPDKIVNTENYGKDYALHDIVDDKMDIDNNDTKETKANIVEDESDDEFLPQRSESIDKTIKTDSASVMTGLDLLDSDDE